MSRIFIDSKVFFGKDAIKESVKAAKDFAINKLVFCVDNKLKENKELLNLLLSFEKDDFKVLKIVLFNASEEPTYDILDNFTENFRGLNIDAIVAVGGGSVLDIAKGVGILLKNPGKGIDYKGMNKVKNPGVPVICVPTTAGTGSETTHTASFIDAKLGVKLGINGKHVLPLFGILLPELTYSCPKNVKIHSGLDAMLHALEAATAKTANEISIIIGCEAFAMLYHNLPKVINNVNDFNCHNRMLLGSYIAGVAMMNAGGGPASGISYPLGVHYNVPHGIAGGIFLPYVIEYNVLHGYNGYVEIYDRLFDCNYSLSDKEKSLDFVKKLKALYKELLIQRDLSEYGVEEKDIEILTRLTIEQRKANLDLNPIPFGESETKDLISKVV